jgi:hypothetical protein
MIIDPFDEPPAKKAGHSPQMIMAIYASCMLFDLREANGVLAFVLPEEKP